MNLTPPPFPPDPQPPTIKSENQSLQVPIKPWKATGLGFLLFVLTVPFSIIIPPLGLLGLAAAIGSLFFKGYRLIFVGYIGTFGLILLTTIIYCANNPLEIR